jgi:hypothetical protein
MNLSEYKSNNVSEKSIFLGKNKKQSSQYKSRYERKKRTKLPQKMMNSTFQYSDNSIPRLITCHLLYLAVTKLLFLFKSIFA